MAPWAGRGLAAVGVGGDESARPARDFAGAFRRARRLGLRTTIHAGEAAGPESIRDALEALSPDRIGHGVRAVEDPALMKALALGRLTLEVCPTSNIATGVISSWHAHPLRRLFDAGVPVTINSDDGTFFDTDVSRELERAARVMAFEPAELWAMTRNAARAAFLDRRERRRLERGIARAWTAAGQVRVARSTPPSAPAL